MLCDSGAVEVRDSVRCVCVCEDELEPMVGVWELTGVRMWEHDIGPEQGKFVSLTLLTQFFFSDDALNKAHHFFIIKMPMGDARG